MGVSIRFGCRWGVFGWSSRWGVVDEAVVGAAGEGEFVDVGVAAVLPVPLGVVDLGMGCRGGAVRFGAAPFQGVQGQALSGLAVRQGAPVVELDLPRIMKQQQVGWTPPAAIRSRVGIGIWVPPPVWARPVAAFRSARSPSPRW